MGEGRLFPLTWPAPPEPGCARLILSLSYGSGQPLLLRAALASSHSTRARHRPSAGHERAIIANSIPLSKPENAQNSRPGPPHQAPTEPLQPTWLARAGRTDGSTNPPYRACTRAHAAGVGNKPHRRGDSRSLRGRRDVPPAALPHAAARAFRPCDSTAASRPCVQCGMVMFSRNPSSLRARTGCWSLRMAFASTCRTRSRVTLKIFPTSSSVYV